MKRNGLQIAVVLSAVCMLLSFTGCNKNIEKGGEGTNYPFSYSIAANGSVTVQLNGSATPDYGWMAESEDETVASVSQKGKERRGKATFKITPASEGSVTVVFTREKETASVTESRQLTSEELEAYQKELEEEFGVMSDKGMEGPPEETSEANVVPIPEYIDKEETARIPKDRVCTIRLLLTTVAEDKNYKTDVTILYEEETPSIITEETQGIPYQIWADDFGSYRLNLPSTNGGWLISSEAEFTGVMKEVMDPDSGEVIGYSGIEPPLDESGKPIVIEAYSMGGVYDESFIINPLAPGNGVLYFSAPNEKKRLEINFSIDENNTLTIVSHSMADYEPAKKELDMVKVEPK